MKRILSGIKVKILVVILGGLLLGIITCTTADAETGTYEGLRYEIVDGEVCITGRVSPYSTQITIPSLIDGYPVTSIGSSAFSNSNIYRVTIPNTVTSIGSSAFWQSSIQSVNIPSSVTSIGSAAFGWSDLTSVAIPSSVTMMDGAFQNCKSLRNVTFQEGLTTIGNSTFSGCNSLLHVEIPGSVISIGRYAFNNCSSLSGIELNGSVKFIGDYAFYNCGANEENISVIIPSSIEEIGAHAFDRNFGVDVYLSIGISNLRTVGESAFAKCEIYFLPFGGDIVAGDIVDWCKIDFANEEANPLIRSNEIPKWINENLVIPEGIEKIGAYTFTNMTCIQTLTIPSSVTEIGDKAFYGCSNLAEINLSEGLLQVESSAFEGCSFQTLSIPTTTETIGEKAFGNDLQKVFINDLVSWCKIQFENESANPASIADYVYINNEIATKLLIPDSVAEIGAYAFNGFDRITSVSIPESVSSIGVSAFQGCTRINTVQFNEGLEVIGERAFQSCSNITVVELPSTLKQIGCAVFDSCKQIDSVYIPSLIDWCEVTLLDEKSNPMYYADNLYVDDEKVDVLVIPNDVCNLGDYLFSGIPVSKVELPQCLQSIGKGTFLGSELKEIIIPGGVNAILEETFAGCSGLEIVLSEGVQSIGNRAFENCKSLRVYYPKTVTNIGESAFHESISESVWYLKSSYVKNYAITAGIEYHILPDEVTIHTLPQKIEYCINEEFQTEGLVLNACYYDGSIEKIYDGYHVTGFDSTTLGVVPVSIAYDFATITIEILIKDHSYDDTHDKECNQCGYVRVLIGDLNGDNVITSQDAIYILYHTFFPTKYPLNQNSDFDGSSSVDSKDAIYILYHTFFPTKYPLDK